MPPEWGQDLKGLPGFDQESGTVRLTDDPEQMRDARGRELMYPGRSHPLTRRAIASVRTGRVSAARGGSAVIAGNLYSGSRFLVARRFSRCVCCRMVGQGASRFSFDARMIRCIPDGLWQKKFADLGAGSDRGGWSCARFEIGERIASVAAPPIRTVSISAGCRRACEWLTRRANELCGPVQALEWRLVRSRTRWKATGRSCDNTGTADGRVRGRSDGPDATRREAADAFGAINSAADSRSRVHQCGLWAC